MIDFETALRIAGALAVVATMLAVFAAIARSGTHRPLFPGREKLVSVIETTPLPHAGSLHVICVGDRYHLIGLTSGAISLLSEVAAEAIERRVTTSETQTRASPRFLALLARTSRHVTRPFGDGDL